MIVSGVTGRESEKALKKVIFLLILHSDLLTCLGFFSIFLQGNTWDYSRHHRSKPNDDANLNKMAQSKY